MTLWWQALILLCCILNCVQSTAPSSVHQSDKYHISFRLARSTRTRVQQLQKRYKEQQLGNSQFEDRSRQLKNLPSLSTDFYSWLNLTDWERLHAAFRDIQVYRKMLAWKREQLVREQVTGRAAHNALTHSMKHIQLDLRDLMSQVSNQMSLMQSSRVTHTSPTAQAPLDPETGSKTVWDSRVEGYIILRDLELYLTKLARDFLLLASKAHVTQQ